jgi:hypothetical protein
MRKAAFPPADPRAVSIAFRVIKKASGRPVADALWGLSGAEKRALREGEQITVKQNTRLATTIAEKLLAALEDAHNEARAARLRSAIRDSFGERAFKKAAASRARGILRESDRGTALRVLERQMFVQGTHVAPFLSKDGGIVLVTLNDSSHLAFMAECGAPFGGYTNIGSVANDFKASDAISLRNSGDLMMQALRGEIEAADKSPRYGPARLLPRGIHYAPWRPWGRPEGFTLLAVGDDNRLVASMDADGPAAAREARRELTVLLEMLAPPTYKDPYDDGNEDDTGCGDSWA